MGKINRVLLVAITLSLHQMVLGDIYVKEPASLRPKFKDEYDNEGNIEHTISTFGYLDYQSKTAMILKKWDTEDGCNPPSDDMMISEDDQQRGLYAFIMKRGGCTYYQKALNVHSAGGRLAIVMFNDEAEDPEGVIPIGPKHRKWVWRG